MNITLMPVQVCGGSGPTRLKPSPAPLEKSILTMLGPTILASRTPAWYPSRRSVTVGRPLTRDLAAPPFPLITALTRWMLLRSATAHLSTAPSKALRSPASVVKVSLPCH